MEEYKVSKSNLVSVILPTYNGELFIADTLQSVLDQTYKNLEIIIVDDCSTDKTIEIIKSFNDNRIKLYVNEKNLGIGENTNKALSLANGEFIMMQDHDDISSPYRAEAIIKILLENPNIAGCATKTKKISGTCRKYIHDISEPIILMDDEDIHASEIFDRLIFHPTIVYRKSILDKIEKPYSGEFTIVSDDDFFYRLSLLGIRFSFLSNSYLLYREHKQRTCASNRYLHYNERNIMVKRVITDLLPFATEDDIRNHSIIQSRRDVLSYRGEKNDWAISWYKRIIAYNLKTNKFNHEKLLKIMANYWKHFATLSNILTPIKAMKLYYSIEELRPYLTTKTKFNREWRKRFIRAMKWYFIKNRNIEKGSK